MQAPIWKKESLKLVNLGRLDWVDIMKKEIEGIVDISDKKLVKRIATATGQLELSQQSIDAIKANQVKKGNVIEASTIAAIQAVKETPHHTTLPPDSSRRM